MSRKHLTKSRRVKQPVERTLVTPEVTERRIILNPETGDYTVQRNVTPTVYKQGKAAGSTIKAQR